MFTISEQLDRHQLTPAQPLPCALCAMDKLKSGQVLQLTTREQGAIADMEKLCQQTGLVLMQYMDWDGEYTFFIRKGDGQTN